MRSQPSRRRLLIASFIVAVLPAAGLTGCEFGGGDREPAPRDGAAQQASQANAGAPTWVAEVYGRIEPSIVSVRVGGPSAGGEGSGVAIRERRIVTNNHVVDGAEQVEVALASGERLAAQVVGRDPQTDLALLAVDRDLPVAELSDRLPAVGAPAIAIGNPLGFEGSVTAGVVSGIERSIPSGGTTPALVNLIQTDAAISPGNSGGALVGADARVIGINVAYIPPQAGSVSLGFAIPAPTVRDVVDQLLDDGTVEHAYLGVQLRPLTPEVADQLEVDVSEGAVIALVEKGGPAADAGMRPGDVVVAAGGEPVATVEDVLAKIRDRRPGDRLEFELSRGETRRTLIVVLGERP